MDQIEKYFTCPYCLQRISMILDLSAGFSPETPNEQRFVEDCEVCCHPIEVSYSVTPEGTLENFSIVRIQ